jgi:hypothetical protein
MIRETQLMRPSLLFSSALALILVATAPIRAAYQQKAEDERSPKMTHYVRTLGPFSVDGRSFTVKLDVNCYKETPHTGMCSEDDQEAVKSMKILDDAGKTRFSKSFPIGFMHQLERHVVSVTLLEGQGHHALEITYTQLPSHANTGVTIQLFGLHNGSFQPFDDDPLEFYGLLGELPPGSSPNSKALIDGNKLPVYVLTSYFYVSCPVIVNWNDFTIDQHEKGEFDVVHQPPYGRKPDIQAAGFVHLYSSPDTNATSTGVNVTPQSHVEILKARYRKGPPQDHDSPNDTWLQIQLDGKTGWIIGLDDYTAIGLSPSQ